MSYCPRCLKLKKKDENWYICMKNCNMFEYCPKCSITINNIDYCYNCVTRCTCCSDFVTRNDFIICDRCFECGIREIKAALPDDSEFKDFLPPTNIYKKIILKRPLLDRPIIKGLKSSVHWSFVEND